MHILSSVLTSHVSPNTFDTFFTRVVFTLNFSGMTSFWDGVVDSFPAKLSILLSSWCPVMHIRELCHDEEFPHCPP